MSLVSIIYLSAFLFLLMLTILMTFLVVLSRPIIRPYLATKIGKNKDLLIKITKNGKAELHNLITKKGITFDNSGEPIQEFKEDKEEIKELSYPFVGGTRLYLKREGNIPAIDKEGKTSALSDSWLSHYMNILKDYIELKKKVFEKKAIPFPIWIFIIAIIMAVVGYAVYSIFM